VTLLADYTLRSRAWVPSAAVVALLGESGVSAAGARTAISRLARRGVLEGSRQGRQSAYRLTSPVAAHLSSGGRWIVSTSADGTPWDGWWTLVAFSLPQQESARRRTLRGQLRWLGFAPLYDALWISPHELTVKAFTELTQELGALTVFRARHLQLDAVGARAPITAWDIASITDMYESFIRRWRPTLSRIRARRVPGPEAVRARTEVMDTYRRFPVVDPHLPLELLPPGWLRATAREVFVAVYDGLAAAAEKHVRQVAARFAGEANPGIRAHTVADLLIGVRDVADQQ
jgi:phenylacetic acid degradation operon negative regulatory protein